MFSEGKIGRTIFRLSFPLVISQIVNVLYNIIDRIYIGNMPTIGEDALAGIGITFPIIMIVSAFAFLFGMGGSPLAAIKLGEGKKEEANKIMMNSFMMLLLIGFILTLILLIFDEQLLYLFGAKSEVIYYSKRYLNIFTIGTISVMLTLGLIAYVTAQGHTMIAMTTVLIGAILNIILDPIFIYVFNLDVAGAAIATVISQTVSALFIILFLASKKPVLRITLKYIKFDFKIILGIAALGISPFIMNATESLVHITFNIQIKAYSGDDYVTYMNLMTIMLSIMQIIILPIVGISQGASPLISYNYGAGKFERVKKAFLVLVTTNICYSVVFYSTIFLFPTYFIRAFNNDPHLLEIAPRILRIFFLGLSLMGLQIACQNTFMALRQPVVSIILALLRKIILLIPLTLILPIYFGINGVFYAEAGADIIAVTTTVIVFLFTFNRILDRKKDELALNLS